MNMIAAAVGRILLALIFIVSGASKLFDTAATEAMITGAGFPGGLAIPTGAFELIAGLAIALGFMTRLFSILLAGFCLLTAVLFHQNVTDPIQAAMALKNVAIAGGLLCLFAHSQMRWSYDSMKLKRRAEIAERDGVTKAHDADVRVAAAEARAEGLRSAPVAAAPVVAAPAVDRNRDGVDDRDQSVAPVSRHDRNRDGVEDSEKRTIFSPQHDRDRNGIDDRAQPIDPRLRP